MYFFAEWSAEKRSALKVFLASYHSQSNESDTVDNNGDNEALPKGSDTRDNESSDPQKVDNCSPLDKLVDVAVQKVEMGAESEAHIASKLCEKEDENPNKLREKEKFETVSKVKKDAVAATDIVSDTSSNNVSQAKHSRKNPNKPDETKDRLSDQSNAAGNDSNQDNHGVHTNTKTDALAENAANTSGTDFGSSESELAAEEEENVPIPYQIADEKWDYIVRCDINNIKKHAENASIEVEIRIQTCFIRSGQYQSDFVQLHSEFVLVWHFLCYLFNFLCCPF